MTLGPQMPAPGEANGPLADGVVEVAVRLAHQVLDDLVRRGAAAVEAFVDDRTFLSCCAQL